MALYKGYYKYLSGVGEVVSLQDQYYIAEIIYKALPECFD